MQVDPLGEPDRLAQVAAGCDIILCLSGVVNARSGGDMQDNIRLALAAVQAAQPGGTRVLLASSAAVYGAQPGTLAEEDPLRPMSAYGRAKVDMEHQALEAGAHRGVPVTALRIGNIAGLDAILGGWRPGFALDCFENGQTPMRSYIGVQSLARILADLTEVRNLPEVLNIAQPGPIAMGALLDAAGHAWTRRPAPPEAIPSVALDVGLLLTLSDAAHVSADPVQMVAEWRAFQAAQEVPA